MEQQNEQLDNFVSKQPLPNATAVLVLGILSIVFCWCYGILGFVMSIIALALSVEPTKLYRKDPEKWSGYGNLQAGRITAIIGLAFSLIIFIIAIAVIAKHGFNYGYDFWQDYY